VRTLAALAFIAGVAALAIGLAGRPTVADGEVLAAEVLGIFADKGVTGVTCDPAVPIGHDGAAFGCTVTLRGGERRRAACRLSRTGELHAEVAAVADPTGDDPARPAAAIPPRGDPWGN
jgi:hypothetical protein